MGRVIAGSDNLEDSGALDISGAVSGIEMDDVPVKIMMIVTASLEEGMFKISGKLTGAGTIILSKGIPEDDKSDYYTTADLGRTVAMATDDVTIEPAKFSLKDESDVVVALDGTRLTIATRAGLLNLTSEYPVSYRNPAGNDAVFNPKTATGTITSSEGWTWYAAEAGNGTGTTADNHPAKTLILDGLWLAVESGNALTLPAGTTVVVNGTNTIRTGLGLGISAAGSATFTGGGTLNVTGQPAGISAAGSLTFNGSGAVNATSVGSAISSNGTLTISGGTLTANGGGGIVVSEGGYTQTGGTVDATGYECGLYCSSESAEINISGGTLTTNGANAAMAAKSITISPAMAVLLPTDGVVGDSGLPGLTVQVVLKDGKMATSVSIGSKPAPSSGGSSGSSTPKVPVIVDGEEYNIGKATTSQGVTTVTVDQTAFQKQLDSAGETMVIPVTPGRNADTVAAQLVLANLDEMAEKEMTLSVQVDEVSYVMPAVAIDTEAIMTELGATDPVKVPVNVTIKGLDEDDVTLENGELVLPPMEFKVTASYNGKSVEPEGFEKYVQRTITIPNSVDAGTITTAVVAENGKQRHVPTEVFRKDGKWYARINSLTNSVYALIHNEKSFADAAGKWYEAVVTEMASRGVIDGRNENVFDGDAAITRAEFAAILVRALGLPENGDASMFTDVASDAWYCGAVGKAYEYGIVEGRGEGIFDPNAKITRQEAMQMIYNASGIAPIRLLSGINPGQYADVNQVSAWAADAASFSLLNGIFKGNDGFVRPLDNITRAESATIILRLLQKSGLVDMRTGS